MPKTKKDADVSADKEELPKKWMKLLPTGFDDTAKSLDTDDLKKLIVASRGLIADIERDSANDAKLNALKEDAKLLTSAYKESQNIEDAKIRYALLLLRERGAR